MWKLSETFLMLATTTLSLYYLPRVAEIRNQEELQKEIVEVYKVLAPIGILGAVAAYLMRDQIIRALFTSEFHEMRQLFGWQLTGDVLKLGSFVFAYVMIGRGMTRAYVMMELTFSGLFVALAAYFLRSDGLMGVALAYSVTYAIYWLVLVALIRREISRMPSVHDSVTNI
jgi:PST family polysaccharide transporter